MISADGAFLMGFQDGKRDGVYYSARQVAHRFPDWHYDIVGVYLNGLDDGVALNSFRVDRIRTPELERAVEAERLRMVPAPANELPVRNNISQAIQYLAGYTNKRFDLYAMAGRSRAKDRAYLLAHILGLPRVPQAKAGMHALQDALYKELGVTGDCLAAQEDDFITKAKAIFERG